MMITKKNTVFLRNQEFVWCATYYGFRRYATRIRSKIEGAYFGSFGNCLTHANKRNSTEFGEFALHEYEWG